jgi:site-specific DNA recombinase
VSKAEAVIYCRASKDKTGGGLAVTGQEADCRALAKREGLTVRQVYADNDITASGTKTRPAYRQMLAELAEDPATVIVWHTDRLHRHLAELEEYIHLAEEHQIITRAVQAGDLDLATPSGRMVARMLGVVARHELEHMSERRKAGKARAAAAGRWKGGRRPFGYESDGVTVRAAEAAAIEQASADILAGVSLHSIARRLNTAHITTATGGTWYPTELRRVLCRARNAGLMEHAGHVVGKAEWPAIVTEDVWRGVCAVFGDESRRTTPGSARQHLLSGLAVCGVCGTPVIATGVAGKGRPIRQVYRDRPRVGSGHVARAVEQLDAFVTGLAIERLRLPDLAQALRPARNGNGSAGLHARMTAVRQRLDQAAELFSAGDIDARQYAINTRTLNADLDALGQQLAALARQDALAVFTGRDPAKVWAGLDLDRRRAVIEALMTVVIDRAPKGRMAGWRAGQPYFDEGSIRIQWHR